MRSFTALLLFALVCPPLFAEEASPEAKSDADSTKLATTAEQGGYAIGLSIGRQLLGEGLDVDTDALAQGVKDALTKTDPRLTDQQLGAAMRALQQVAAAKRKALGEKNKAEGVAFLETNKKKRGVVTLESGLQYEVIKSGNGDSPKSTDRVRTHYHGTLLDGTVFDSSVERDEPITFAVGGVIRGWTEALQLMKVGDKWRLYVPAELAYSNRGSGPDIGPHATLIFEVELLGIE